MVFKLFSEKMQKLIEKKGFIEPTMPQTIGIPEIMKGGNVLIIAPTGLGKTEACTLPLLDAIWQKKYKPISMLYINPLRSLSRDLLDRLFWWADKLNIDISVRHGDTPVTERKMQTESPPDCLITTPETLSSILVGKKIREHLKNVKFVVIDEIHEIIENKRGTQLAVLLERLKAIAGNYQRIALSATVGDAKKIAEFVGNAKIIHADAAKTYDIKIEFPKPQPEHKLISDQLYVGENTVARLMRLRDIINQHRSVITFTNTRETAEVISSRFRNIDKNLMQEVHHGSLSKESRISSEKKFKNEELKALIATSSLELGIDIGSIDFVVQYLSPRKVSKLIQRIGRSGHGVGRVSNGMILTEGEDAFESGVIARRAVDGKIEDIHIHEQAMDVLSAQIVGMCLENYDMPASLIYNIAKDSYPYRNVQKEKFMEILKFLASLRLIWMNPVLDKRNNIIDYTLRRSRKSWQYYYENLSTIPDTRQMRIISIVENEPIGNLDESFVAEHAESGSTFICKGRAWRVIQVEENKVIVEPVDNIESAIPAWEGELIPVPYAVAQDVGSLRAAISGGTSKQKIMKKFNMDENSVEAMIAIVKNQKKNHIVPDNENFLLENHKDFVILHSCCGTATNDAIGKYVAAILTAETGISINVKADPYRIIFQTKSTCNDIKKVLLSKDETRLKETLELSLANSSLFKHRFLHVARRFGIIARAARFDRVSIQKIMLQYAGTPVYEETMREIFLDKFDMITADEIIEKIKSGTIKLHIQHGLSHLGELGLIHQFADVVKPAMPKDEIFAAFHRRLLATHVRLVCTNCCNFTVAQTVKDIDDRPACPKCNSGLIGVVSKYRQPIGTLKKAKLKKSLTKDEKREADSIKRGAELVMVYGKKAVMTLAGRGVGPDACARILARLPETDGELLKLIYEAEKQFARTKIYWKA
ncbi:MAG: DEAD/DEAH box helicase [Candidatus Aenigmatarchaeota archaeon]